METEQGKANEEANESNEASENEATEASAKEQAKASEASATENEEANESATAEQNENAGVAAAQKTAQSNSNSNSNSKVFICHATGSTTNPFVLIHVSSHAVAAHMRHQDGRDVVLGSTAGPCPTAAAPQVAAAQHVAAAQQVAAPQQQQQVAAAQQTPASTRPTSGAVKGATKVIKSAAPATRPNRNRGVLGAVTRLSRTATAGTLPFTGLRLWIVELVALGLILLGLGTRLAVRRGPN